MNCGEVSKYGEPSGIATLFSLSGLSLPVFGKPIRVSSYKTKKESPVRRPNPGSCVGLDNRPVGKIFKFPDTQKDFVVKDKYQCNQITGVYFIGLLYRRRGTCSMLQSRNDGVCHAHMTVKYSGNGQLETQVPNLTGSKHRSPRGRNPHGIKVRSESQQNDTLVLTYNWACMM